MNAFQARTDDMQFLLSRVLNAPAQLQTLPAFAEADVELMQQVLHPLCMQHNQLRLRCKEVVMK